METPNEGLSPTGLQPKRRLRTITFCYCSIVRVIAHTRLVALASPWPEARRAVEDWHEATTAALWSSPADVKASDPTASILANRRVVFNILGNRFRLIVKVDYSEHKLFVRFFGTHQEYDRIDAAQA